MQQAEEEVDYFVPCFRGEEKQHVSLLFCGDSDAGRTTVAKHLMFAFCGVSERSMEEQSVSFPAFMVRQNEEPCRGVAIPSAEEFFTKTMHYTFSFAHHEFFKKVIARTLRVDLALLVVAANQKGSLQARNGLAQQHARFLNALGVKQPFVQTLF